MKKWFKDKMVVTIVIVVLGLAIVAGALIFTKDKVVAEVEGEKITETELQDSLLAQYGTDTLDTLITNKLIELEAKKQKVTASDKEIQAEVDTLAESYGSQSALEDAVKSSGTTMTDLKKDIEIYVLTQKMLEKRIEITDEEMQTYFEENKDTYATAEQVQASHILVADEATAKEVKAKLDAGEDFAALAKEYSTDTATADSGGDLGYFGKGEMEAAFETAAFSQEVNTISEPIQTSYGYHIIKVVDHKQAAEANFEDSKDDVKQALLDEKMQTEYTTWIDELKKDYDITNTLTDEYK